jgi:hypothetical protein
MWHVCVMMAFRACSACGSKDQTPEGRKELEDQDMNLRTTTLSVLAALALMLGNTAQAATIVSYDFSLDDNPTVEAANSGSSAMTGAGWTSGGSPSFGRSTAGNYYGRGPSNTVGTSWVGFTITADTGYALDLDQLAFDYYVQQRQSGTWFIFEVRSSVDSYASAIAGTYSENPADQGAPYENATLDLTGGSYDGLESISFRLYAKSDSTPNFNDIVRWDNILVSGDVNTTAIPEPASLAMGLVGLTLIAGRRRR